MLIGLCGLQQERESLPLVWKAAWSNYTLGVGFFGSKLHNSSRILFNFCVLQHEHEIMQSSDKEF
jgi:hypothetical protein